MMEKQGPFFTVAIPAYKREVFLKEAVRSCVEQSFHDFELLIGNDDPLVTLTPQMFGGDSRIRIINRSKNLGALGNMNTLIQEAYGRYFVWLADDDLLMPGFLSAVDQALKEQDDTQCVYTSFSAGYKPPEHFKAIGSKAKHFQGREFLKFYLKKERPIQCWYGVFEIHLLRSIGGMQQLGHTWEAPCADMLFPLQAAQAGRVAFIDDAFIFFRLHEGSVSTMSADYESYRSSQLAFLEVAWPILSSKNLQEDACENLYWLMKWFIADYVEVMRRSGCRELGKIVEYYSDMQKYSGYLKNYFWAYQLYVLNRCCWLTKEMIKGLLRRPSL